MRHGKQLKTTPFSVLEYDIQCTCCMETITMYVCGLGAVCFWVGGWMDGWLDEGLEEGTDRGTCIRKGGQTEVHKKGRLGL